MKLKKSLGQHFLIDTDVLYQIVDSIKGIQDIKTIVEIGPGMGALTKELINHKYNNYFVVELDDRFIIELPKMFPQLKDNIFHEDILKFDLQNLKCDSITFIGNFPYNISSQIIFKIIDNYKIVKNGVGMFQKEVAKRIASKHKSKDYGVISVLFQNFYEVEYLFDIAPSAFNPTPKVFSGVIKFEKRESPLTDYKKLKIIVKKAFNQRRKTLNNSLKGLIFNKIEIFDKYKQLRPEQLSIEDFVELSKSLA